MHDTGEEPLSWTALSETWVTDNRKLPPCSQTIFMKRSPFWRPPPNLRPPLLNLFMLIHYFVTFNNKTFEWFFFWFFLILFFYSIFIIIQIIHTFNNYTDYRNITTKFCRVKMVLVMRFKPWVERSCSISQYWYLA